MSLNKQSMSDKFQIGCRTYLDETSTDVQKIGKPAKKDCTVESVVVIPNETSQPVIELLSSDDDKPSSLRTSLCKPSKPSPVDKVSKSNSSKLRIQYHQYRDKFYSVPSEDRSGRAMNMQEFIWNSIQPNMGEYQYDPEDSRDMKMKELAERNKVSCRQYLEDRETKLREENGKNKLMNCLQPLLTIQSTDVHL